MIRGRLLAAVCMVTMAAAPAWAQRGSAERADPDSRPSGPERTGSAVDRPSSSGGGSSSGGSVSSSGGGATSSSSDGGGGWSAAPSSSAPSNRGNEYVRAPERPSRSADREQGRARGSNEMRRPSGGGGSSAVGTGRARGVDDEYGVGTTRTAPAAANADDAPSRRAVPTYSRPSDGRQPTGVAVDRPTGYYGGGGGNGYGSSYYPYYPNYPYYYAGYPGYYAPGYGLGLGLYYNPFWYDPYYGSGYGSSGYYGGGYGAGYGGYQGGSGSSSYGRGPSGNLRLKIKPREAQVFVDGYFVGVVDNFDGLFQKLDIDAGGHRIEVKAPGFEATQFDVLITPGETVTYKGELRRNP